MQKGKGNRRRVKGLLRQPQHDGRILADGVEHDGPLELRGHLAQDVDALGLQQAQMAQALWADDSLAAMRETRFRRPACMTSFSS